MKENGELHGATNLNPYIFFEISYYYQLVGDCPKPVPNPIPLQDCTNTATKSTSHALVRTWKKLAREPGITVPNSSSMVVDRRPSIDVGDIREGKKVCMVSGSSHDKENTKVVGGS